MEFATPIASKNFTNLRKVSEGLYAGEQPPNAAAILELKALGVKTVIDLQHLEMWEPGVCAEAGISFFSIPLPGIEVVTRLPEDKVTQAVRLAEDSANHPVFIHCQHGKDRTGAIVGCIRVDSGWTAEQATAEMIHFGDSWLERGMRSTVRDWEEDHKNGTKAGKK